QRGFVHRRLRLQGSGVEVVDVAIGDAHTRELADLEVFAVGDDDHAVDLGRIRAGTGERTLLVDVVDEHVDLAVDPAFETLRGDILLEGHQAHAAFVAHFLGYRIGQFVRGRALDRRVREGADTVEFGLGEKLQQFLEIFFGLAGEAGDEGRANGQIRAHLAPLADAGEYVLGAGRAAHGLEDARTGVLERDVQIRKDLAFGHQRDQVVDARVGI